MTGSSPTREAGVKSNVVLTIDKEKLKKLKTKYKKAELAKQDTFVFEGSEIYTKFGIYLLEYLEPRVDDSPVTFAIGKEGNAIFVFNR